MPCIANGGFYYFGFPFIIGFMFDYTLISKSLIIGLRFNYSLATSSKPS